MRVIKIIFTGCSRSPSRRCLLYGDDAEHVQEIHANDAPPNTCYLCDKLARIKKSFLKHSWVHNNDKTVHAQNPLSNFTVKQD